MLKAVALVVVLVQIICGSDIKEKRALVKEKDDHFLICKHEPIDLGIVLDSSSSIRQSNFITGLRFLQEFLQHFKIGTGRHDVRVAVIPFGKGIYINESFNLDTYRSNYEVEAAVGRIVHQFGIHTDTGKAIQYMDKFQLGRGMARPYAEKVCIVLTDGNSQDWEFTEKAATEARRDGIKMFAVGVGDDVRTDELLGIAGTSDRVIRVQNYDRLRDIIKRLANETCIHKPKPTTTPRPATACGQTAPGDVNFVFSPADMGIEGTLWTTDFINQVLDKEDLETGFRFGTITGSCPEDEGFRLDQFQDADALRDRVRDYERFRMSELVAKALYEGFTPEQGGRDHARSIAVLVIPEEHDELAIQDQVMEMLHRGVEVFVADPFETEIDLPGTRLLTGPGTRMAADSFASALCE